MISSKYNQVVRLINTLNVNDNNIVIFVDSKSEDLFQKVFAQYGKEPNIYFIKERFDVGWGNITTTKAVVTLMENSLKFEYDYFTMMSESCLPLYPDTEIKKFLEEHNGKEFIDVRFDWTKRSRLHLKHKPYDLFHRKHRNLFAFLNVTGDLLFGWLIGKNKQFKSWKVPTTLLWWTTSKECTKYMVETIKNKNLIEKYKDTLIADEHIFAEVILNSRYYQKLNIKNIRGNALLYCDWYTLKAPRVLRMKDYNKIYHQKYPTLYARKFDSKVDNEIINKIYENRENKNFKYPQ